MNTGVKARCKNCGKEAPADQFKLHYKLRMMVCPACYTGKTELQKADEKQKAAEPMHPPGWDKEDEYLEKMARFRREETKSQFTRVQGADQVKCTCVHCKYTFKYDPYKQMPRVCPYCNTDVPKFKESFL